MTDKTNILGVILSGGESQRFGEPKAFALYDGEPFYQHAVNALTPHVNELVIVSHDALKDRFSKQTSVQLIGDVEPYIGKGPLSGLYASMKQFEYEWYFVLACDMPYFDAVTAGRIAQRIKGGVMGITPRAEGRIHPLSAIYHHTTFPHLVRQLESGSYRMREWIGRFPAQTVEGLDEKCFKNVNDQQEYQKLQ
ncbi:molybdenum cofactor guanylyltransferase [Jeotgalibacillus sp. S-D1]|uniref:molybdenum cofactor guanylyltransferase n=1 Tax=Jeotgalibacillus sp. S-D1 TaxID=2552189 RepID=UPI00105A87BD|nr:molybdenum cofactor guanylyltransferase [Jeotgalibacillus sp. S-D1]TDL31406.1 molybdenum cofactor guanylyltransferase [Jeotgalibacillus sp. S-D1]